MMYYVDYNYIMRVHLVLKRFEVRLVRGSRYDELYMNHDTSVAQQIRSLDYVSLLTVDLP